MITKINDLKTLKLNDINATPNQIKKSFHILALRCHPDKGGTDEEFRSVHEAYERLTTGHNYSSS